MVNFSKETEELILVLLESLLTGIIVGTPETKKESGTSDSVLDMTLEELTAFCAENDIPKKAVLTGVDNGHGDWEDFCFHWTIETALTKTEREELIERRFNANHFQRVARVLISLGYKRIGVRTSELIRGPESFYKEYLAQNHEPLFKYYSQYFEAP